MGGKWHQLGHMQVCTSLQTDYHASTPPLCLLQAGCPSCRPTNSVKALMPLKAKSDRKKNKQKQYTIINTKIQSICKIIKRSLVCSLQNKL